MGEHQKCCGCAEGEAAKYQQLDNIISLYKKKPGALIQVLHLAQEIFGYLPLEVQEYISQKMRVPVAEISGVITFYSYFSTVPRGKHSIKICMGTACYVKNGQKLVEGFMDYLKCELGGMTEDKKFSLDVARCIGVCGIAPAVMIGNKVYPKVQVSEIPGICGEY